MKIIFGAIGAIVASSIASAIGVQGAFRSIAAAVGLGAGWLLYGLIEDRQERKRIEVELEQDRIRHEQERNELNQ